MLFSHPTPSISRDFFRSGILSPQILKERSERDGAVEVRLKNLEIEIDRLYRMHNGHHPETTKSKEEEE